MGNLGVFVESISKQFISAWFNTNNLVGLARGDIELCKQNDNYSIMFKSSECNDFPS